MAVAGTSPLFFVKTKKKDAKFFTNTPVNVLRIVLFYFCLPFTSIRIASSSVHKCK